MINNLRFFCQRVLPVVYDDSLSFQELLYKVVCKINEMVPVVSELDTNIEEAVKDILTEWMDDGTLADIINQTVFNQLNADIAAETAARLSSDHALAAYLALLGFGFDTCRIITVGQSGYDYNNLVTAVNAANSYEDEPVIIAVYRGIWATENSTDTHGLTLNNNKILYGMGSRETVNIRGFFDSSETTKSTLCLKDNCAVFNCFINGNGGKYTIHDDFHNEGNVTKPQYRMIKNCEIYGQNMASGNVIGAGIKSNQHVTIEDSLIYSFDNLPVRYHNWTNCEQDSFITIKNCILRSAWGFGGLRLSVLNNYAGYTNYKPVWVNVENSEISGGIIIQAEANNPTVNMFHLSCDDPTIPIECRVGDLNINPYNKPFKIIHAQIDSGLIDKCICHSGAANTFTGFGGGNDLAVMGVGIDSSKIAVAGTIMKNTIIFRNLNPTTHDIITINQDGTFGVNGTGRAIGFCDAQGFIHFDFRI